MVRRTLKFQREADPRWAEEVAARPGCEDLFSCEQCGACSAICPLSVYMDFGPRRVIGLVREGFRKAALTSQTVWLCASCYACDMACPRRIQLTDLMGSLKREAVRSRLYPRRFPMLVVERELCEAISRGRCKPESWRILASALENLIAKCRLTLRS